MRARLGRRLPMVVALLATCWIASTPPAVAQTVPYRPKNGVLNWKAVLLGGGFRVTTAIPLHGDFSRFSRVEIVRPESLVGADVPPGVLSHLTRDLAEEFLKGGRFSAVVVESAVRPPASAAAETAGTEAFRGADPLAAPIRPWSDHAAFDQQRQAAANAGAARTLLVRCQVLDYAKGNKLLQFLFLDLGNAVLTLRFSYYDLESGEELGRSVISSDSASAVVPSAFSARSALTGIVEGLVDQVTRRKISGER
jgi:hypothetical protein